MRFRDDLKVEIAHGSLFKNVVLVIKPTIRYLLQECYIKKTNSKRSKVINIFSGILLS